MKRELTVNGADCAIEVLAPAPACRFRVDGAPEREAHVETPEPGVYSILIDGRSYDAFVTESPSGLAVTIDGFRFDVSVRDPRRWSRKGAGSRGEGVQTIASPMPGKVVRVLAAAGDEVAPGQGIVVVEAMKMQNELKADRAGIVLSLAAKEGATVTAGEILATVESASRPPSL
jgi:biotin carboxyl carrier protein